MRLFNFILTIAVLLSALTGCGKILSPEEAYGKLLPDGEVATGDSFGNTSEEEAPRREKVSRETRDENEQIITPMVLNPGG